MKAAGWRLAALLVLGGVASCDRQPKAPARTELPKRTDVPEFAVMVPAFLRATLPPVPLPDGGSVSAAMADSPVRYAIVREPPPAPGDRECTLGAVTEYSGGTREVWRLSSPGLFVKARLKEVQLPILRIQPLCWTRSRVIADVEYDDLGAGRGFRVELGLATDGPDDWKAVVVKGLWEG